MLDTRKANTYDVIRPISSNLWHSTCFSTPISNGQSAPVSCGEESCLSIATNNHSMRLPAVVTYFLFSLLLSVMANPQTTIPTQWTTPLSEGSRVPEVTFQTRVRISEGDFDWKERTTKDYFAGKRVVLFALPGAFTPTCSASHLPGYEASYEEIKALGVDEIYCLSVNDAFVMRQWGIHQGLEEDKTVGSLGFKKVKLIPDGAAAFTRGMGMSCVWSSHRGFGERSWRYSMVVNDGVIEKLFIEQPLLQNSEADPFEVTDAATMINYLKSVKRDEL